MPVVGGMTVRVPVGNRDRDAVALNRSPSRSDVPSATCRAGANRRRLLSSLRLISGLTIASRVLGLVRDLGMATLFGNGPVMDAFSVAFRIPNILRRLFGEGALTAAFLPVFVRELEHSGRESAWRLAGALLTLLAVVLAALVLVGEISLLTLGALIPMSTETKLLIDLSAILLPYVLLICLTAQVSAIMHALNHFTWPAVVPILLNLAWLGGIWFVAPAFADPRDQIRVIAASIVAGGVLQLLVPLPWLFRLGFCCRLPRPFAALTAPTRSRALREIIDSMLPVLLGLSIIQLNTVLDALIAWGFAAPESGSPPGSSFRYPIESGSAAALYLGQRMYQFPMGVFGIALGTVLFPLLSRHAQRGRLDLVRLDLVLGLRLVALVGIPGSVGLALLSGLLADTLFRHGSFDAHDARQTSAMIAAYGVGVWAYCGLLILNRACYAVGEQSLPIRTGLVAVAGNLLLNLTLIWFVGGVGLAIATAIVAGLQCIALAVMIQQKIGRVDQAKLISSTCRILAATAVMTLVCLLTGNLMPGGDHFGLRCMRLLIPLAASVTAYSIACLLLGIDEWKLLLSHGDAAAERSEPE